MSNKKKIIIIVLGYLILLLALGLSLDKMLTAQIRAGKYSKLAMSYSDTNGLLRVENESLKKQLKELGYNIPGNK